MTLLNTEANAAAIASLIETQAEAWNRGDAAAFVPPPHPHSSKDIVMSLLSA